MANAVLRLLRECCDIRLDDCHRLHLQPLSRTYTKTFYKELVSYAHLGRGSPQIKVLEPALDAVSNIKIPAKPSLRMVTPDELACREDVPYMTESEFERLLLLNSSQVGRPSILFNTPPPSSSDSDYDCGNVSNDRDSYEVPVAAEHCLETCSEEVQELFHKIRKPVAPCGKCLADEPLCVSIDIRSMLGACKTMSSLQIVRLPSMIAACIEDTLDIPEEGLCHRALSCVRVIQYERVQYSSSSNSEPVESSRPRLLRYHYPYIAVHPHEKSMLSTALAKMLNETEMFGILNWQRHVRGIALDEEGVYSESPHICCFDWANVSKPCFYSVSEGIGTARFSVECLGIPEESRMEEMFPMYIHQHALRAKELLEGLCKGPRMPPVLLPQEGVSTAAATETEEEDTELGVEFPTLSLAQQERDDQCEVIRNLLGDSLYLECECSDEQRIAYADEVDAFTSQMYIDCKDDMRMLIKPCPPIPTCPCPCMVSIFSHLSLLPLILSNRVRYRLNFGRDFETNVSCSLSKSDLLVVTEMISKHRMSVDEDSLSVLRILQTCFTQNTNSSVQLWKQICWRTRVSPKDTIEKSLFYINSSEHYTSSMLQHMAADDATDTHGTWKKKRMMEFLRRSLGSLTDTAVAEFVSTFLDGSWVWSPSGKDGCWYHFDRSLWSAQVHEVLPRVVSTKVQKFVSLFMERLRPEHLNRFVDHRGKLVDQTTEPSASETDLGFEDEDTSSRSSTSHTSGAQQQRNPNGARKAKYETFRNRLSKLKDGFQQVGFKNRVIRELKEVLCVSGFKSMLDSAPEILAIKDGVLMVRKDRVDICKMRMQHMCSMSTKQYLLRHNMSESHPMVCKVTEWIEQLFPAEELRDFFWKYMASILYSGNADKIFMVWSGDGDNSKSMLVKLIQKALGDYCVQLPASMLSEKEGHSSSANPCKARAVKSKLVVYGEPEDTEQLRAALIKGHTGGDDFGVRNLYESVKQCTATFKMLMVCNRVPPIRNPDQAVRRRVVVLPFNSVWVDNPPTTKEDRISSRRFKKDPHFEKNLDCMAPAFLWLMCTKWKRYSEDGLTERPAEVMRATNDYFNESNLIEVFVKDCLDIRQLADAPLEQQEQEEDGASCNTRASKVYSTYRRWHETMQSKHAGCMTMKGFQDELKLIIGENRLDKGQWLGVLVLIPSKRDGSNLSVALSETSGAVRVLGASKRSRSPNNSVIQRARKRVRMQTHSAARNGTYTAVPSISEMTSGFCSQSDAS